MENIMDPDPAKWCGSFGSGAGSAFRNTAAKTKFMPAKLREDLLRAVLITFGFFENLDIVPLIRMDLQCLQLVIIKIVMIDCKNARVFRKRLGYSPFFHGVNTTPHGLQLRVLYVLEVLEKRKTVKSLKLKTPFQQYRQHCILT